MKIFWAHADNSVLLVSIFSNNDRNWNNPQEDYPNSKTYDKNMIGIQIVDALDTKEL